MSNSVFRDRLSPAPEWHARGGEPPLRSGFGPRALRRTVGFGIGIAGAVWALDLALSEWVGPGRDGPLDLARRWLAMAAEHPLRVAVAAALGHFAVTPPALPGSKRVLVGRKTGADTGKMAPHSL